MKKYIIMFVCAALLLSGCGEQMSEASAETTGVYFEKIDEDVVGGIYNSLASYTCFYLHYDGRVYTSSLQYASTERGELPWDSVLGDTSASVLGNHGVFWSEDGEELSEITYEGTIYQVKGYDASFRVAVYYESEMPLQDTYYYLMIFDHLNDVSFENGGELFDELLCLSDYSCVKGSLQDDLEYDITESAVVEDFLAAIYESTELEALEDSETEFDLESACILSFYDTGGLNTDIMVYEDGFAVMEFYGGSGLVVGIDEELCRNIAEETALVKKSKAY